MVIVDTSVFIDFLRGDKLLELEALILDGQVILSMVVKLELLAGVRKKEEEYLKIFFEGLVEAKDFAPPSLCEKLLRHARGRGLVGGLPDLLILAEALQNKARLYTRDVKQKKLAAELKVKLFD